MEELRLFQPEIKHQKRALEFKQAFFDIGETSIDGSELLDRYENYEDWLSFVSDNANEDTIREGSVHTYTYFVLDTSDIIVGIIDLRLELNDFFKDFGHSGYSVLPSRRRLGYATRMLAMVKDIARKEGLKQIQLSALDTNTGSIKTILNNGGKLTRTFDFYGNKANVYTINL